MTNKATDHKGIVQNVDQLILGEGGILACKRKGNQSESLKTKINQDTKEMGLEQTGHDVGNGTATTELHANPDCFVFDEAPKVSDDVFLH